jgi:hypothetical protein
MEEPSKPTLTDYRHVSSSLIDASARDAAKLVFDMLAMEYSDDTVSEFMMTTDGRRLQASLARMVSFVNEKNIQKLEAGLWK